MFEWRFVTHSVVHSLKKVFVCMLVHCWVSGALSPFFVPDHLAGGHGLCVLVVVGVLCENCIVDASIKHVWQAALLCGVLCVFV